MFYQNQRGGAAEESQCSLETDTQCLNVCLKECQGDPPCVQCQVYLFVLLF